MSYQNGFAALNLQMCDKVPRTEYSAGFFWELIAKVTGKSVSNESTAQEKTEATRSFIREWDYGFYWNIYACNNIFDGKYTKMGHAEYETDGVDFSSETGALFDDPHDALSTDFYELYGERNQKELVQLFNNDYRQKLEAHPDCVNMTGIYVTLVSGLLEILGWDTLLMCAGIDQKAFGELVNRYAGWIKQYFEALALSDSPVVMIHDDITWTSGAFLHPDFYREFIFPNYKKMFAPLIESGKIILYTSDGDYTQFIDDIAGCSVNGFVMEPVTDMQYIADKYGKTHSFTGNADTNVLLRGTKEDIEREVKRCMDIGKKYPGYFMAVGNHIPPNTPVDNALYYNEMYEKYAGR